MKKYTLMLVFVLSNIYILNAQTNSPCYGLSCPEIGLQKIVNLHQTKQI